MLLVELQQEVLLAYIKLGKLCILHHLLHASDTILFAVKRSAVTIWYKGDQSALKYQTLWNLLMSASAVLDLLRKVM